MDPDFIKYLSGLGVGGILAALFYYQNNKNALDFSKRNEELAKLFADRISSMLDIEKGRTEMLVALARESSANTAKNNTLLEALHRRLDREEFEKAQGDK